jgi:hypothetical protein
VAEDSEPIPPVRPGTEDLAERYVVLYRTTKPEGGHLDDARLIRLDRETGERYERSIPGWNEEFGFIGGGVFYRGWQLNNLSTSRHNFRYDERTGEYIPLVEEPYKGVDGDPYHFMNRFLAYHPESDTFDLLFPDVPDDRYPQLCYNMPVGEHLYITANDIWSTEKGRPLGSIEGPVGQLMVLQSHPVGERE